MAEVGEVQLSKLEGSISPEQISHIYKNQGKTGLRNISEIADLQAKGKVKGLEDWVDFTIEKDGTDLGRAMGELVEAKRLSAENPDKVINIGGDARAPTRPNGDPMKSFDITIETPQGHISRSTEVTETTSQVSKKSDVTEGIKHAIEKINSRKAENKDIPGDELSVTIRVKLQKGKKATTGGELEIANNGDISFRTKSGKTIDKGNLFDQIGNSLNESGSRRIKGRRSTKPSYYHGQGYWKCDGRIHKIEWNMEHKKMNLHEIKFFEHPGMSLQLEFLAPESMKDELDQFELGYQALSKFEHLIRPLAIDFEIGCLDIETFFPEENCYPEKSYWILQQDVMPNEVVLSPWYEKPTYVYRTDLDKDSIRNLLYVALDQTCSSCMGTRPTWRTIRYHAVQVRLPNQLHGEERLAVKIGTHPYSFYVDNEIDHSWISGPIKDYPLELPLGLELENDGGLLTLKIRMHLSLWTNPDSEGKREINEIVNHLIEEGWNIT